MTTDFGITDNRTEWYRSEPKHIAEVIPEWFQSVAKK